MKTEKYTEDLIKKFFEGKTSNEEENELWLYFSGKHIPDHLKQHKKFFSYYSNDFMKEVEEVKLPLIKNTLNKDQRRIRAIAILAVAAILIFAIIFPFIKSSGDRFDPYENSYMLVNGKKIYDIELIKQQEKDIREMSAKREKEYQKIYVESSLKKNELQNIMMLK